MLVKLVVEEHEAAVIQVERHRTRKFFYRLVPQPPCRLVGAYARKHYDGAVARVLAGNGEHLDEVSVRRDAYQPGTLDAFHNLPEAVAPGPASSLDVACLAASGFQVIARYVSFVVHIHHHAWLHVVRQAQAKFAQFTFNGLYRRMPPAQVVVCVIRPMLVYHVAHHAVSPWRLYAEPPAMVYTAEPYQRALEYLHIFIDCENMCMSSRFQRDFRQGFAALLIANIRLFSEK